METVRRWNGWGDEAVVVPLPSGALAYLEQALGKPSPPQDRSLARACERIDAQPSRLPKHPLVSTRAEDRLRSGLGQSTGDWIRLRFGEPGPVTDGVAWPEQGGEVRQLLDWAAEIGAVVIPCGGATSVVGHLAPPPRHDRPVLTLNLTRLRRLLELDRTSQLARFEAGVLGPDLEAQLRVQGFTLGHFPQSFEYSSLGGWVATRSSGQQSLRYGRIEQLFAGGRLESPAGTLALAPLPASAAGPDPREWVLGSEGRLGVLTEVVVRVSPLPERERFVGVFLPDWGRAMAAVRLLAQARAGLSMLRLASPLETRTTLRLAGHPRAVGWLERYLALRGLREEKCLLLMGITGSAAQVRASGAQAAGILRAHGAVGAGSLLGRGWAAHRFRAAYLRNALWDAGYAVDTVETALPWPSVGAALEAIEAAGRGALAEEGERCHASTHLSHVYPTGSSLYTTLVFRIAPDFERTLARWRRLKQRVSEAIVAAGGTISHQHGVGKDHAPYLARERGALGMAGLGALIRAFDPRGVMDGGNLTGGEGGR